MRSGIQNEMLSRLIAAALVLGGILCVRPAAAESPLQLETKIPLGAVSGRIDHLAVDLGRRRLFVAELGNDSVGVVDIGTLKTIKRIAGLREPQGVGYVASTDALFVANAGDGSVRMFRGADLLPAERIELGDDADNIRIDPHSGHVYVGYGNGALAVIDPTAGKAVATLSLQAHPEGFQIDPAGARLFANVPDAGQIAVIDLSAGKQITTWPLRRARANFPMAIDAANARVLAAFRRPATLIAYHSADGSVAAELPICADADDVFVDEKRRRVYVSCGEGSLDVLEESGGDYKRVAHIATPSGARTSLFVPELDRLFLAVRATGRETAGIWIYRPAP